MILTKSFLNDFLTFFLGEDCQSIYVSALHSEPIWLINHSKKDSLSLYDFEEDFSGYKFHIEVGATKLCFVFDDANEVIKIPFKGEFEEDEETGKFSFQDWDDILDYEIQLYNASEDCIKEILLLPERIINFNGIPVYLQKKVSRFFRDNDQHIDWNSKMVNEIIHKWYGKLPYSHSNKIKLPRMSFLQDILIYYKDGEDIINNLDFPDLHSENYGYLSDGRPVIFDYGGYLS